MSDLNRNMFYKVKFDVRDVDPGSDDALWCIVMSVRAWLERKAHHTGEELPWSASAWTSIKFGGTMESATGLTCLYSRYYEADDAIVWAVEISENQRPEGGMVPRKWITEVGYSGSKRAGAVSVTLSFEDRPGFIGEVAPMPAPSIPRLVHNILANSRLSCSASGYPLPGHAETLSAERVDEYVSLVCSPERTTPVVYISIGRDGSPAISPDALYDHIGPNALVFCPEDRAVDRAANSTLFSSGMECRRGAVRVYAANPKVGDPADRGRHRYLTASRVEELGEEALCLVLRRALAQDASHWLGAVRLEDVRLRQMLASRDRRMTEQREQIEDAALQDMSELESDRDGWVDLADQLQRECDDLKRANYSLEAQMESLRLAVGQRGADSGELSVFLRELGEPPSSPQEIARLFVLMYPERIDFTERGWKSLDSCVASPDVLWAALSDIATILQPLFRDGCTNIPKEFGNRSTFSYARGEGRGTHRDPKLMAQRVDHYKGREIDIEGHVKSSSGDPSSEKFLRVYLDWLEDEGKVVIGSCGEHLDNYSTRKVR